MLTPHKSYTGAVRQHMYLPGSVADKVDMYHDESSIRTDKTFRQLKVLQGLLDGSIISPVSNNKIPNLKK